MFLRCVEFGFSFVDLEVVFLVVLGLMGFRECE